MIFGIIRRSRKVNGKKVPLNPSSSKDASGASKGISRRAFLRTGVKVGGALVVGSASLGFVEFLRVMRRRKLAKKAWVKECTDFLAKNGVNHASAWADYYSKVIPKSKQGANFVPLSFEAMNFLNDYIEIVAKQDGESSPSSDHIERVFKTISGNFKKIYYTRDGKFDPSGPGLWPFVRNLMSFAVREEKAGNPWNKYNSIASIVEGFHEADPKLKREISAYLGLPHNW